MKLKNFKEYLIKDTATIKASLIKLGKLKGQFCVVIDKNNFFKGTLTDGDIRRGLLRNNSLKDKILNVYNKKPFVLKKEIKISEIESLLKKKNLNFIPLIKGKKVKLVYSKFFKKKELKLSIPMLIMAGGEGRRLRPFTNKLPKPMLRVRGTPIIETIIINAKKQGINNFYISIKYLGNKIKNYLKDGKELGVKIRYIKEQQPLGTAGALFFIKNIKNSIIVSNADIISNINYKNMIDYHKKFRSHLTVGAITNYEKNHYGEIFFRNNQIIKIEEKKEKKKFINSGIYILGPYFKNYLKRKKFLHMTDLIKIFIEAKKKVYLFPIHENWFDYGLKEKYLKEKK